MLRFKKLQQPLSLTHLQTTPHADWQSNQEIRDQLLAEQGHLCVYCQRRIPCSMSDDYRPGLQVEHWLAQSTSPNSVLKWTNLLGVCPGNPRLESGSPVGEVHCDQSRGNQALFLHPVEGEGPDPRLYLVYNHEGVASSLSTSAQQDSVQADITHLNLNNDRLRRGRRELCDLLRAKLATRNFEPSMMRKLYQQYSPRQESRSLQYCEVARYYLRRWARQKNVELE